MLTPKQNMLEAIKGGNPERFTNQYEAVYLLFSPNMMHSPSPQKGMENVVNAWGVTNSWPANTPGSFPVHTPDKILIKDIEHWSDYVKAPSLKFSDEEWAQFKGMYDAVDGELAYKACFVAPGLFEQTHHMSGLQNALEYYIEYPDEMHALIDYLTDWELELAEGICTNLKPDAIFHHDDWGSEKSTFLRPSMFADFFVEPYKKIYKYYHDHGVELVFHHADSYGATLVPYMIEMGIDVWQGCMESNDVPKLVKEYGPKMTFMGDIDNKSMDFEGWTREDCRKAAVRACENNGLKYFIPCITQGGPGSLYENAYMTLCEEIDKYNEEKFGIKASDIKRLPWQVMFSKKPQLAFCRSGFLNAIGPLLSEEQRSHRVHYKGAHPGYR